MMLEFEVHLPVIPTKEARDMISCSYPPTSCRLLSLRLCFHMGNVSFSRGNCLIFKGPRKGFFKHTLSCFMPWICTFAGQLKP